MYKKNVVMILENEEKYSMLDSKRTLFPVLLAFVPAHVRRGI